MSADEPESFQSLDPRGVSRVRSGGSAGAAVHPPERPDADPLEALRAATVHTADRWSPPAGWVAEVRGRLAGRSPGAVAIGLVTAVVVVAGIGWWAIAALRATPSSDPADALPRATATTAAPPASAAGGPSPSDAGGPGDPSSAATQLIVQAAGAVVHPGLFRLPAGSRLSDLVDAAGGLAPDADPDRLNLASPLADGARVWIPRRGEADPTASIVGGGAPPGPSAGSGGNGGADAPAEIVDLNTADAQQLDALPGVGPATAAAIIDYRTRHGPFRSVDELAEVRGIGDAKLGQLRDRVRV